MSDGAEKNSRWLRWLVVPNSSTGLPRVRAHGPRHDSPISRFFAERRVDYSSAGWTDYFVISCICHFIKHDEIFRLPHSLQAQQTTYS